MAPRYIRRVACPAVDALRRTPLYDAHVAAGARLVPFAGWEMPVQYEGVGAEHLAVRSGCGVFDVSHMGEVETEGPGALALLQRLLSNDVAKLDVGGAQYSVLCREDGGVLDDLFTYRLGEDRYLTVTNAANHERDLAWFREHAGAFDCEVRDRLADWAMLAVQGPEARGDRRGVGGRRAARANAHRRRCRSPAPTASSAARATRARTGSRSSARPPTPPRSGTRWSAAGATPGRPGRARHAAPRGLLPPLRQRPLRGPQPDRGRAGLVLQGGDRLHRLRGHRRRAGRRHRPEAGAVRDHRARDPAPGQRA